MKAFLCTLFLALPLFAAPPPFDVERPISVLRIGATASERSSPLAASDGETFLVTWTDSRPSTPSPVYDYRSATLVARVDGDGHVLDVPNTVIPSLSSQTMFWTGTHYLLAGYDVYLRVRRDGTPLDAAAERLPGPVPLAFNGSRYLGLGPRQPAINAVLLGADLRPLRTTAIPGYGEECKVASNGDTFLVAFTRSNGNGLTSLWYAVLDRDGALLAQTQVMERQPMWLSDIRIASDGHDYLVLFEAWIEDVTNRGWHAAFFGAVVGGNGALRTVVPQFGWLDFTHQATALAWTGRSYSLACVQYPNTTVTSTSISADGTVGATVPMSTTATHPYALVYDGKRSLFLHSSAEYKTGEVGGPIAGEVFTVPEDVPAGHAAPVRLEQSVCAQLNPAAATTSSGLALAAWQETIEGSQDFALYAKRIDAGGAVVDRQSILIDSGSCWQSQPAAASDGRDFVVAWATSSGIYTRRITANGLLAGPPLHVTGRSCIHDRLALASNGSEYLLAWFAQSDLSGRPVARFTRLDANGQALDIGFPELATRGLDDPTLSPLIATDGHDFLVSVGAQRVVRVYANGLFDTPVKFVPMPIVALAFDGKNYVAAGTGYVLHLAADGTLLDSVGENTRMPFQPSGRNLLSVACGAGGCLVAARVWATLPEMQLYVWPLGSRDAPQLVASASTPSPSSAVILLPGALPRLIYTRVAPEQEYGDVSRLFVRTPRVRQRVASH